jgi:hypothetical protein
MQKKMAEKDITLKPVLKRFPPGDRWTPINDDQPVLSSLTEGQERDYVIKAGDGMVFVYSEQEIAEPEPPQPKTYNLYGEYE